MGDYKNIHMHTHTIHWFTRMCSFIICILFILFSVVPFHFVCVGLYVRMSQVVIFVCVWVSISVCVCVVQINVNFAVGAYQDNMLLI